MARIFLSASVLAGTRHTTTVIAYLRPWWLWLCCLQSTCACGRNVGWDCPWGHRRKLPFVFHLPLIMLNSTLFVLEAVVLRARLFFEILRDFLSRAHLHLEMSERRPLSSDDHRVWPPIHAQPIWVYPTSPRQLLTWSIFLEV